MQVHLAARRVTAIPCALGSLVTGNRVQLHACNQNHIMGAYNCCGDGSKMVKRTTGLLINIWLTCVTFAVHVH